MHEVIKVEHLSKSYGNLLALDNVCLSVRPNKIFGLLGANGAGKSTTIECILGTRQADSGTASVLGCDPRKNRRNLFQKVGVQFQECDYQPEIKVSELCEETACLYKNPANWKQLCAQLGIGDKLDHSVKSLSGGERQRLFIVLALIPDPQLVFLDELTTGLDAKARRDVWKRLADLRNKGLTIFLTSHFMDEVETLCDEICILKKGKIVFQGTIGQAKAQCNCEKFEDAYLMLSGEEETDE
jgi:ABC-2 type transport system ATP-binding protein